MENPFLQNKTWAVLCLLVLSLWACQKDEQVATEPVAGVALSPRIQEAKQWVERWQAAQSNAGSTDTLVLSRTDAANGKQSSPFKARPKWEKAWVGKDGAVEVPLDVTSRVAYSTNPNATKQELESQLTRLIVLKDKHGKTFAVLMHMMGEAGYLQKAGYSLEASSYRSMARGFTGKVAYFYLDGQFCYGWGYKEGEVTGAITAQGNANTEPQNGKPIRNAGQESCVIWYTVNWEERCTVTTTSGNIQCSWNITGSSYWLECGDDPHALPSVDDPPEGGVPGSGSQTPIDPCIHAINMNSDKQAQQRLAELKSKISSIEYGYMVDVNGENINVMYRTGDEKSVPLVPEAGKKYSEIAHTHLAGDRCAISPGDIHYIYKELYQPNLINVGDFRFVVLLDDHAFSLQITDELAFEKFAKNNKLNRSLTENTIVEKNMIDYFKVNGVDIQAEISNPTVSPATMTDLFVRFFEESNSGLGVSRGHYDPVTSQPVWEALKIQGTAISTRDCN